MLSQKYQVSLSKISSTFFLSLSYLSSLYTSYIFHQIKNHVCSTCAHYWRRLFQLQFIIGVYNTVGKYWIFEGHIGNVELKIHQHDYIVLPKAHLWVSNECVDFWIHIISTSIRFFSCIYSQTYNPSTLSPQFFSQ